MKKKILIALVVFVVLGVALLGFALMNANSLIAKFKPELERIASDAVGSKVTLGTLSTSVFPNPHLTIDELKVANEKDPADAFTLKNFVLYIKLMPLLSKKLEVSRLEIDSPTITITKDAEGVAIAGLPRKRPHADKPKHDREAEGNSPAIAPPAGLDLNLENFDLKNATIVFKDTVHEKEYAVSDLGVRCGLAIGHEAIKIPNLSVDGKLLGTAGFTLEGKNLTLELKTAIFEAKGLILSLLGNKINLDATVDTKKNDVELILGSDGITIETLEPFYDLVPALKQYPATGIIKPALKLQAAANGAFNANGTVGLDKLATKIADLAVSGLAGLLHVKADQIEQHASGEKIALSINGQPMTADIDTEMALPKVAIKKFNIEAFSGTTTGTMGLVLDEKKSFDLKANVTKVQIDAAMKALLPTLPPKLLGTVDKVTLTVTGSLAGNLMATLAGATSVHVTNAVLKDVNIAAAVLKAVNNIPFLSQALFASVPDNMMQELTSPDTKIQSLDGDFRIGGNAINTNNLVVQGGFFTLEAQGTIGFDSNIDLNATIIFSEEFSRNLAMKTKEIGRILDVHGRLVIPLSLKGVVPKIMVLPNVKKLIEVGAKRAITDQAGKFLDRALGGTGDNPALKKGLGNLFGF